MFSVSKESPLLVLEMGTITLVWMEERVHHRPNLWRILYRGWIHHLSVYYFCCLPSSRSQYHNSNGLESGEAVVCLAVVVRGAGA